MKYTHESKELNTLLGKKVKITLWNDKILTGVLSHNTWRCSDRYEVANYSFRKTHIKKIEACRPVSREVQNI